MALGVDLKTITSFDHNISKNKTLLVARNVRSTLSKATLLASLAADQWAEWRLWERRHSSSIAFYQITVKTSFGMWSYVTRASLNFLVELNFKHALLFVGLDNVY